MDSDSLSPKLDHSEIPKNQQASKKRKVVEKTVVTVKIETKVIGKLKNEGPPSDSWSWRKYGQKPIKGSPHPRGYYRCSTSKGCSAKKQVERCKTDDSLLIITYTSSHNHPGPHDDHDHIKSPKDQPHETQPKTHDHDHDHHDQNPPSHKQDHQQDDKKDCSDFPYIQVDQCCPQDIVNVGLESDQQDTTNFTTTCSSNNTFVLDKELMCNFSASQEENDFFDELEELPTYSNFKSFMRSHLSDEIRSYIPVVPS